MNTALEFDRLGFPLWRLPNWRMSVHVLPASKFQLEAYLADTAAHGDDWYEQLLRLNPRQSFRQCLPQRERWLCTGVLPGEARALAEWLGPDFRLPSLQQWRTIYAHLATAKCPWLSLLADASISVAASAMLRAIAADRQCTLREGMLLDGGVFEWVHDDGQWCGVGSPRDEFFAHLLNPLNDCWHPLVPEARHACVGFRLLRIWNS